MIKVYETTKAPIKSWVTDIEDGAFEQALNMATLPFIHKHVALMPDAHQGFGMPIGGVMATKGVIVPNAVGKDIGCGMCAIRTNIKADELTKDLRKKIAGEIRQVIPMGLGKIHNHTQDDKYMPRIFKNEYHHIVWTNREGANKSLGTLGSGNHFIELQKDLGNNVWIMIHSGSRNLGSRVADYYNKSAKELNAKWFSSVQSKKDLAFLPLDYQEAQEYIIQMEFCVEFALANRKVMMDKVLGVLAINVGRMIIADSDEMINIAHNYARQENHFGSNVWVHRKGATSARKGELGIIPGSQGSKSYIVRGLGNKDSFESCSHGAGRVMGRKEAKRKLDLEKEIKILDEQDIVHGIRNINDLDEATSAYKNIEQVMTNQSDLVEVVTELFPILSIKG